LQYLFKITLVIQAEIKKHIINSFRGFFLLFRNHTKRNIMPIRNLSVLVIFCILTHHPVLAQNYSLINDATTLSGCHCYQLTPDLQYQGGGVYQNNTVNLNNSFDYKFSIYLGSNGSTNHSADGICFVLTDNITQIGANGGGLGYSGLTGHSLAVEYDTWKNSPYDPNDHHMAMEWGGQVQHPTGTIAGPVCALTSCATMADGAWHTTELIWNANTQVYTAYFDGVLRLTYTGNIVAIFFAGNPVVNWGWSGSTGNAYNTQRFCILSISSWVAPVNYQTCNLTVPFTDLSTSNVATIQSWAWIFGDPSTGANDTSNLQNPIHVFSTTGVFNVSLIITDISGCPDTFIHIVTIAPPISMIPTDTSPLCNGGHDGSISLATSGGFGVSAGYGGYAYTWNNGVNVSNQAGITAGTYDVTVTDGVCTTTATYSLPQPTPVGLTKDSVNVKCNGMRTGSITLTPSGGTSPYQVRWSDAGSGFARAPLPAGTYSYTVTDAHLCALAGAINITQPPAPFTVKVDSSNVLCFGGSTGTITLVQSGGAGPYAAPWWQDGATGTIRNNLTANTYYYTDSDNNGCLVSGSVHITQPAAPFTVAIGQVNNPCFGDSSGTIALSLSGGTTPYGAVTWRDTTLTGISRTGLKAGPYSYIASDANGCGDSATITVIALPLPTPAITLTSAQICIGTKDTLAASGGVNYAWSNAANTDTIIVSPGATTPYSVTVTDVNHCTASMTNTVIINPLPTPTITPTSPQICIGNKDTLTTGVGVSYAWSNSATTVTTIVSPDTTTSYTVTVTDAHTCTASDTITVIVNPLPTPATTLSSAQVCSGNKDTLTASGGVSYAWSNAANTDTIIVSPGATTTYSVTVTDINHCAASTTDTVIVNPLPTPSISLSSAQICIGAKDTLTTGGGASYAWSNAANTDTTTVSPLTTTTYSVTVTDAHSCSATATGTIIVNPLPTLSVGPDTVICTELSYNIPGLSSASSIIWAPDSGLSNANIIAPVFHYPDSMNFTYTVIAIDTVTGCTDTVHLNIVSQICVSYIDGPQAFSPNGDNSNDFYTLFSSHIASYQIRIYNRWGEMVYESTDLTALNDMNKGWDGTYQGKPQSVGTFVYYLTATDNFNNQITKKGNITLLR
jgi:gliding motility-associated-like protein